MKRQVLESEVQRDLLGVVLAGGAATRLPNKVLLPMLDLRPVIFSGLELLERAGCAEVAVVIPPFSAIAPVIRRAKLRAQLHIVTQAELTGVPHAISLAARAVNFHFQRVLAVCADNVFPSDFPLPRVGWMLERSSVSVISSVPWWKAVHLAKERGGVFQTDATDHPRCFAGWLHLTRRDALDAKPHEETVAFLNRVAVYPDNVGTQPGWHDIGTPESYLAYWQGRPAADA